MSIRSLIRQAYVELAKVEKLLAQNRESLKLSDAAIDLLVESSVVAVSKRSLHDTINQLMTAPNIRAMLNGKADFSQLQRDIESALEVPIEDLGDELRARGVDVMSGSLTSGGAGCGCAKR